MKILVIQQKMIGDVLTSSILLEALRDKYSDAELHYLINSHTFPVVENNPFVDEFVFFTKEIEDSKRKFYTFLKAIKAEKYDIVIDAYGQLSSNLITLFSKANIKISYYKKQSQFIYTKPIKRLKTPKQNASLAIENRFKLLEPLGIEYKNTDPKIYLKEEEIALAKSYLKTSKIDFNKKLIMISVLGSNTSKTYPAEYMALVLDMIVNINNETQIVFNYIPKQKDKAKKILDSCLEKTKKNIFFNVYGKNLREFLAITNFCNALIGNEGGANNMAKALNTPTFTIFSPALNKHNWFGEAETKKHVAIHLSDYLDYNTVDAKKTPETYYTKLKPSLLQQQLNSFLNNI